MKAKRHFARLHPARRPLTHLAFESRSSILSVSEMAVALDDVLAREFDRGRRLRCGLRTGVEASAPSVTWRVDNY